MLEQHITLYCNTHEKRKKELQKYLDEYKVLDKMTSNIIGKRLYDNFKSHKDDVYNTVIELGYKIEDISKSMPKNYYNNHPEILKSKLLDFIEEYKRFPRIKEMEKVLRINTHFISKFGGMDSFKKLIKYDDSNDLIDLRGDYNHSVGELICANYFCSQGLKDKYTREQYPFPKEEGYFRSDFTFYLEDKELHVEVWGFRENEVGSEIAIQYHKIRKIKESLYNKYSDKMILIGIDYKLFDKKYDQIQNFLYELFAPYINLKFKNISYKKLLSPSFLNDQDLFNEIMEISPDSITFPTTFDLKNYSSGLYTQILKRGYTYNEFANKYGVKTKLDKTDWTKKLVLEYFSKILKEGKEINKQTMNEQYSGLSEATEKYGYMTKLKIDYFNNLGVIPSQELSWVVNLANNTTKTTSIYSKTEVNKAKKLLDKLYMNINNKICCQSCGKEMIQNHIYEVYCKKCTDNISKGKVRYLKPLYNELEYNNNFVLKAVKPYLLTTKGFNSVSDIKIQSYRNYFNMIWIEIVKKYGKFDDLYDYIIDEFRNYYIVTNNQDIHRFTNEHKYITYDILVGIGLDKIYSDAGVIKQEYNDDGYKSNFINIKNQLGYIPLYAQFEELTNISINSYANKFKFKGIVYDNIVKMYTNESDFNEYKIRQQKYKSETGKRTGSHPIYSEDSLRNNFTKIFDEYFTENNKYPSKIIFHQLSSIDESTYRKRLGLSWTQVKEYYGY